jgi:DNA invertase Pin-like site-specific DNA recombinase
VPIRSATLPDGTKREFDAIMAWSVDRLGRSMQHLVKFVSEIDVIKIDLYLHQQGPDTTTLARKPMLRMMGVFVEFKRAMIQKRVRAWLVPAKGGGEPTRSAQDRRNKAEAIRRALRRKPRPGMLKIAKELSIGTATVQWVAAAVSRLASLPPGLIPSPDHHDPPCLHHRISLALAREYV